MLELSFSGFDPNQKWRISQLLWVQSERLELPAPFCRSITKSFDSDAADGDDHAIHPAIAVRNRVLIDRLPMVLSRSGSAGVYFAIAYLARPGNPHPKNISRL